MSTTDKRLLLPFEPASAVACPVCGYSLHPGEPVSRYCNGDMTHDHCEREYVQNELGIERGLA